jgi:hypothetical protein
MEYMFVVFQSWFLYEGSHTMPDIKRKSLKACTKYWSDYRKIVPLEGDSQFVKIKRTLTI